MTELTENEIAKVMEGRTKRQIAIAYLRAQRRARESDLAFDILADVTDLSISAMSGKVSEAEKAGERLKRRVNTAQEHEKQRSGK